MNLCYFDLQFHVCMGNGASGVRAQYLSIFFLRPGRGQRWGAQWHMRKAPAKHVLLHWKTKSVVSCMVILLSQITRNWKGSKLQFLYFNYFILYLEDDSRPKTDFSHLIETVSNFFCWPRTLLESRLGKSMARSFTLPSGITFEIFSNVWYMGEYLGFLGVNSIAIKKWPKMSLENGPEM